MTRFVSVWRIATDTPDYVSEDLTGKGAELTGGRWNPKGLPMIYASTSRSLACLETVVHLADAPLPLNRYLVEIQIPVNVWNAAQKASPFMLLGWDAMPPGLVSVNWGMLWVHQMRSAVALVPSALVPEEFNVLLNPRHPDSEQITASKIRKWLYDSRLRLRD